MCAFNPTSQTIHPPLPDDALGAALITALSREPGPKVTWNLPIVLIAGLATAGLLPLVILLLRFRTFAISEKFLLKHVTEWMQKSERDQVALDEATAQLGRGWHPFVLLGLACAMAAFSVACVHVLVLERSALELWRIFPFTGRPMTVTAYAVAVTAGCIVGHGIALAVHVENVRRFAVGFSAAIQPDDLPAVEMQPRHAIPDWTGIVAGIVLAAVGIVWGLPMMLAAGAHRRYINEISPRVRSQFADRISRLMRSRSESLVASA